MKKDIIALLESESGTFRLNNFCYLKRYTKNGLNEKVDVLQLWFDSINDVNFVSWVDIQARDYDGIIAECDININRFFSECAAKLTRDLKAGYRNVSKKGV